METTKVCKVCGAPLQPDAPEGLCPRCLGAAAVETQSLDPSVGKTDKAPSSSRKAAVPPAPAEIAQSLPQLEVLELLGQGGMGVVYKARQRNLDRIVALKILPAEPGRDPAFAERFAREAKALAKLNHPNIVSVYDFGQAGKFYYFLMEFVDGVNLRQLEQTRRLTPPEALGIVPKICEALQYAHDEGIVHRDIKPGNILIDKRGRVKIADFGLAKLMGKAPADLTLTQPHQVMGTPRYMAPEQMEHPRDVDHRADIYSLGVVFYEMLTGDLPMGRFVPPSRKVQVDVRLDEVVLRALENEPERRYQQASEVKTDLESIPNSGALPAAAASALAPHELKSETPAIERRIEKAALAVWISAALNLAAFPIVVAWLGFHEPGELSKQFAAIAGIFLPATLLYGFVMYCARKMRRSESHRLAVAGSILLLIMTLGDLIGLLLGLGSQVRILTPGNFAGLALGKQILLPGHLAGVPAAIWALVVLSKSEVRVGFDRRHRV